MHGLSKVIWPLVVFLTVSVWTTLLYRIMSKTVAMIWSRSLLMTVRVIFSQGADDPLAVLPEQNNFLLKDKGYFVF